MEDINMEDINMEDIRKNLFNLEEYFNDVQKRNICYKLKNADENKTKNVKKICIKFIIYYIIH